MRFGAPIFSESTDPEAWAAAVAGMAYRAAYCPVALDADDATIRAFAQAAARKDIVIAEVGAWSNPLSPDQKARQDALAKCQAALSLADRIGARCAVNIAGSLGVKWDGPDRADLTPHAFDQIVASVRTIIDAVKPTRTFYTLEPMPWMYPDSTDSYLRLIAAIDRTAFAVHFDPVNLVKSPQDYFESGALIRDFCARLGPRIRSCHAKDVLLGTNLTVHLDEMRPGKGGLDFRAYLRSVSALDPDVPLMLEHLPNEEEYKLAAEHIRRVAREEGVSL